MITINGKSYSGNNISIQGSKIIIDGKVVDDDSTVGKAVEIKIVGVVGSITTDKSVICEAVSGDVHAGGSVSCDNVFGNVLAGGSVSCDEVGGNINAGGSVSHG